LQALNTGKIFAPQGFRKRPPREVTHAENPHNLAADIDVAREVGQEAERQTTPADTPNSNHEPRVRRTRAATP